MIQNVFQRYKGMLIDIICKSSSVVTIKLGLCSFLGSIITYNLWGSQIYVTCLLLILNTLLWYQLVGRLDNSAVSATGAKLAFKSNEEIELQVRSVPLDEVIPESEPVLLIKIDVQGWEYHVLKGASKLLSRKGSEAPYLIYEEDERLLQASNSSSKQIRDFLHTVGYKHCTQHGTDAHCTKKD